MPYAFPDIADDITSAIVSLLAADANVGTGGTESVATREGWYPQSGEMAREYLAAELPAIAIATYGGGGSAYMTQVVGITYNVRVLVVTMHGTLSTAYHNNESIRDAALRRIMLQTGSSALLSSAYTVLIDDPWTAGVPSKISEDDYVLMSESTIPVKVLVC